MDKKKRKEFIQAMNTYYKLKSAYENSFAKEKAEIMKRMGLSWREKRREFAELKPKCINCKRPVGTLFSNNVDPNGDGRSINAVCGDRNKPCDLDISINLGLITNLKDTMQNDKMEINENKRKISFKYNSIILYQYAQLQFWHLI
jgi:hypothetical protein